MDTAHPDYKATLSLPQTAFPMKAALAQSEPKWIEFWTKLDLYQAMAKQRQGAEKFILTDGPPYANGDIHIGHALNKILKDIILKSKHLSGYQVHFIPGWDCHGLPIEHKVEKKIGKAGQKVDAKTFRQKCREYAQEQIANQRQSFMRLGVVGEWDNYYSTMNYRFEANIMRTLGKVIAKGHLHREDRPVHWCIDCGSALAEAELEYVDKQSHAIDVAFAVVEPTAMQKLFQLADLATSGQPIKVVIWTTTPWTLPANQAVAVHPELTYVLLQLADQRYIVAAELVDAFVQRVSSIEHTEHSYQVLGTCYGKELEHQQLQHPFLERCVPIILGKHVTTEVGTGCVHTAPAHGYEDYVASKKYGIKLENPVAGNGCFLPNVQHVGGQPITTANEILLKILAQNASLLSHQQLQHSYPHCWRHKTPVIFRATPQWFISMEQRGLRAQALQAINTVTWIPSWGQARMESMISGRPDWCISRQRTWGTPIPLFFHKETGALHPNTQQLIEQVACKVEQEGIEGWYSLSINDMLGSDADQYIKSEDTLDVWFDSGAIHACVAAERAPHVDPVDLYLEGTDQYRGWFQTSLLSSVAVKQRAPYKTVLTHGFTIDADKRKMSKSLGNTIVPEQITSTLGADVLRLWVAATDYRGDLHVSEEILKRTSDAYRRIRNTARFLLANLHDFDPAVDSVLAAAMLQLDQWIIKRASVLQTEIVAAYAAFQFHIVYQKIHNFCVDELGSFYLDVIKDRQYTSKATGIPRRSAQTAMYYVVDALARWLAPILSFTAEEIWQHLPGAREKSVFLTTWLPNFPLVDGSAELGDGCWQQILRTKTAVNKELENLRINGVIGSALETEVILYCDAELYKILSTIGAELRFILITSQAEVRQLSAAPSASQSTDLEGLKLMVEKSVHEKCARCWHRCTDVNTNTKFPAICGRCVANLTVGEQRSYA